MLSRVLWMTATVALGILGCGDSDSSSGAASAGSGSTPATKSLIFSDGFENATPFVDLFNTSRWDGGQRAPSTNVLSLTPPGEPVHGGAASLKCQAAPYDGTTASKADISRGALTFGEGHHFWFSGYYFIPSGSDLTNLFILDLEDLGGGPVGTSPGRRLFFSGGPYLACDPGKFHVPATTVYQPPGQRVAFPRDRWVRIDVHFCLSSDPSLGVVEVWQDGVAILNDRSRTLPESTTVYDNLQLGITANGNTTDSQTLYLDDVEIYKQ